MSDMAPLSRDHVHGSPAEGAPMVVLYAPLGSAAFAAAHAVLERCVGGEAPRSPPRERRAHTHPLQCREPAAEAVAVENMDRVTYAQ